MGIVLLTEDGSHSLKDERTGETYHSIHGAVQESRHIFIDRGLKEAWHGDIKVASLKELQIGLQNEPQYRLQVASLKKLNVFEVGFGTGLNAFLTWMEAEKSEINIRYTSVELYPVDQSEWEKLNYESLLNAETAKSNYPVSFQKLHTCSWGTFHQLSPHFSFRKLKVDFTHYLPDMHYDLIYFDAFSPEKQPELWLPERFTTLAQHCNPGAILTTYCAKGIVKQALRDAGFTVERLHGPPGKRHMLRGRWQNELTRSI